VRYHIYGIYKLVSEARIGPISDGRSYAEVAHPVKLVDTHGAGDAFIGALAARWASGAPVAQAVRFANAAAALFVSTPVDQKKAVTSDQVTRFLSACRQQMS
jgi:ribokinase